MYIKRLRVSGIKCFGVDDREVDIDFMHPDDKLAGWTVLAGRNGSGKSTLLKLIALSISGIDSARTLQGTFSGWISKGRKKGETEVSLELDPGRDLFSGRGNTSKQQFDFGLVWRNVNGGSEPILKSIPSSVASKPLEQRGPWAENPTGWFICGYGPFRRLTGHASDAQRLMVGPYHVGRLVSLFREDASLVESIQWLKEVHTKYLEIKPGAKDLRNAALSLLGDRLLPEGMVVKDFDSEGLWVEQGRVKLPLRDLSDGYRTMAAFVLDLLRQLHECYGELPLVSVDDHQAVSLPGIVLIDEMDIHLHVSWQQRVGFWLKSRFPKIQFIVTTHSPFICQAADRGGLIRLPGPGDNSKVEQVSDDIYYTVTNGGADEAVMTELFGLEYVHSEKSERIRDEVAIIEARVLNKEALASDRDRLKVLLSKIPKTTTSTIERSLRALESKK